MVATLVSRERRPIWVALAITFPVIAAAGTWLGLRARDTALDEGTEAAARAGRTVIAPLLAADGVNGPLAGRRAHDVRNDLEHALANRAEAFGRVRVFTTSGDILLDSGHAVVTGEDLAASIEAAANADAAGRLSDGMYLGYVAVETPQGARVVELTAHAGRFVPAGPWTTAVPVAAALALLCLGLATVTTRAARVEVPATSRYRPAIPRRPLAVVASDDALPTVSVFAIGHDDLEVRHDQATDTPAASIRTTAPSDTDHTTGLTTS
jgi:hypothetical protein